MSSEEQTPGDSGSLLYSDDTLDLDERNRRKINDLEQQFQQFREAALGQIEDLQARVAELEAGQEEMRDRTNLLKHVKDASQKPVDERAVIVLQRMHADAASDPNRVAEYDFGRVDTLVGSGFSSRSPIYNTMERAEKLVDDEELVDYEKHPRHSPENTKLVLDLKAGDLPADFRSGASPTTQNTTVSRDDDTDGKVNRSEDAETTTEQQPR